MREKNNKLTTMLDTLYTQKYRHRDLETGQVIDVTLLNMGSFIGSSSRNILLQAPTIWKLHQINFQKAPGYIVEFTYNPEDGTPNRALITSNVSKFKRVIIYDSATANVFHDKIVYDDIFSSISYKYHADSHLFVDDRGNAYSGSLANFDAKQLFTISRNNFNSVTKSLLLLNAIFKIQF